MFGCGSIMTLSEFDTKRCEKLVARFMEKRRPPPHVRAEIDLSFRITGQSVEIFEIRRHWRDKSKKLEHSIAKVTYNKSKRNWRVFWQRADLKWHSYTPTPEVASIEDFLAVVRNDEHGCFFG
jgi:ribosomal protein L39E